MRWWLPLVLLAACDPEEASFPCEDHPVVTWDSFGEGFVTQHCQSCDASTSPNLNGAPESVTFDDLETTLSHADRMLAVATGYNPIMPPEGGVPEDERLQLEIWLNCYAE